MEIGTNNKCIAIIKAGKQCSHNKKTGDYCGVHSKNFTKDNNVISIGVIVNNSTIINEFSNLSNISKKVRKPKHPTTKKYNASLLQAYIRRFTTIHYNKMRGPALINRSLCNNPTDMYTFDDISEIHPMNFYIKNRKCFTR